MKSFTSTEHLKIKSMLRVYKKGYGYAKLSVMDVNEYFVAAFSPEDFYNHVSVDDILDAYLWREGIASHEFRLVLIGKIISSYPILIFSHTSDIQSSRERKCLRASVDIPFKFYQLGSAKSDKSFYLENVVFLNGRILELGDRDAVLQTDESFSSTRLIRGHLPVDGGDIEITCEIISCTLNQDIYSYTMEYIGMSEADQARILDYIFSIYKE